MDTRMVSHKHSQINRSLINLFIFQYAYLLFLRPLYFIKFTYNSNMSIAVPNIAKNQKLLKGENFYSTESENYL